MLFFSVTLGFFAENQREHYIESLREKQYMESFLEDLAKDKVQVARIIDYTTTQIKYLDTAITILSSNQFTHENNILLYRASLKTGGNPPITFIDRKFGSSKFDFFIILEAFISITKWAIRK